MYYGTLESCLTNTFKGSYVEAGASSFYKKRFINSELGIAILTHHNKSPESSAVQIPGSALSTLNFEDQIKIIKELFSLGGKFTRLDLYVDTHGQNITQVEEAIEHTKNITSTALSVMPITPTHAGNKLGWTLYLGSRSSNRFWRIYDKGFEQSKSQLDLNSWHRVEVELKQGYAHDAVLQITNKEHHCYALLIQGLVISDSAWINPPVFWSELKTIDVQLSTSRPIPNLKSFVNNCQNSFFPRIRMLSKELNVPVEDIFLALFANDHEPIVSEPRRFQNFIDDFHDSILTIYQSAS
jgi:DNA relaxase NicK